jgi:hypothetical protein
VLAAAVVAEALEGGSREPSHSPAGAHCPLAPPRARELERRLRAVREGGQRPEALERRLRPGTFGDATLRAISARSVSAIAAG